MTATTTETGSALPRLKQRYREEIVAALREQFGYANVMQVPAWSRSWSTWASARPPATPS